MTFVLVDTFQINYLSYKLKHLQANQQTATKSVQRIRYFLLT